ncbi:MAG: hypothetical protein Q9O24_13430 [Gammaproteobacteria bacterium]|nr:hypothetical protein [Gammaproteobacteria bacterium]
MKHLLSLMLLPLLMLSACSSGKDKPLVDYFSATSHPALQLPSDLKIKKEPTAFIIPELKKTNATPIKVSDYPPNLATSP